MKRYGSQDHLKMPLFFKLWFAFIACLVASIFGVVIYGTFQIVTTGPEGIGRTIGGVIKGINEGQK